MNRMVDRKDLHYNYPMFADQTIPNGELTLDKACHACWYYAMLATKNKELVGSGIHDQIITVDTHSNETVLWRNKNYMNLAKSVCIMYGLETPEEFLQFADVILKEGQRNGIEFAMEIFLPWKDNTTT